MPFEVIDFKTMHVYLDNAATTPLDKQVIETMLPLMEQNFGNPSSIHSHGRVVRSAIEKARKKIAELLNASPAEIFFTSGGTEADNTAILGMIETRGVRHVISSEIEHHAVETTLKHWEKKGKIQLSYVQLDDQGHVDLNHLESLLQNQPGSLVSLMHANNEIGNLLDLHQVGELCRSHGSFFHSDTVQTMGHYVHNVQTMPLDFLVGAGHKFHGPKGVGFLYVNPRTKIQPFIHGGAQERNMRGGTENVYGIVGIAKALEIAYGGMDSHRAHIEALKRRMIEQLRQHIEGVSFNGASGDMDRSLYTVLNVSLPPHEDGDMLLFNLDISKISASGGSACSSGSEIGSHVLMGIGADPKRPAVRFSFSKYNTEAEIDYVVAKVAELVGQPMKV
jgi:cysteine desulfurase